MAPNSTRPARLALIAILGALGAPGFAWADVSFETGNFFIRYSDIELNGGFGLKIERVYNSQSSRHGLFGFGWGSDIEVYLEPQGDGSVYVFENRGRRREQV